MHVAISVWPQERIHNAAYRHLATKAVSIRTRKIPCCQESAGCSKVLLKRTAIQQPRKSRPFFDNLYNRNVRDVDT